jgi:hypothetical protein
MEKDWHPWLFPLVGSAQFWPSPEASSLFWSLGSHPTCLTPGCTGERLFLCALPSSSLAHGLSQACLCQIVSTLRTVTMSYLSLDSLSPLLITYIRPSMTKCTRICFHPSFQAHFDLTFSCLSFTAPLSILLLQCDSNLLVRARLIPSTPIHMLEFSSLVP